MVSTTGLFDKSSVYKALKEYKVLSDDSRSAASRHGQCVLLLFSPNGLLTTNMIGQYDYKWTTNRIQNASDVLCIETGKCFPFLPTTVTFLTLT